MTVKKAKLPEGIRKLPNGRYQARYPVQRGGRTIQMSAGTFAHLTDAKDARSLAIAQVRTGTWVDPYGPKTLFSDWTVQWLDLNTGGNTKTQSFLRARILPQWGHRRLGQITSMDVQIWMNTMVAEGLAPYTIHGLYSLFKRMMQDAVDHELLVRTPCRTIAGKPKKKPVKKTTALSVEQILQIELAVPTRYRAMIHLAAWAGLRWGECAGLQWADVDLEAGVLHIQRSGKNETTKNGEDRFVVLAPETVDVLRTHRRDFGSAVWVFTTQVQKVQILYADFRKRIWLPAVAGFDPKPTFHDLRHAYVTHMVAQGLDWKVLSRQVGHSSSSFTMDVYGVPRQDAHEVTVEAVRKAMHVSDGNLRGMKD